MSFRTTVSAIIFVLATVLHAQSPVDCLNEWRIEEGVRPLVELESLSFFCKFYAGINAQHGHISHYYLTQEDKDFIVEWAATQYGEPVPSDTYECVYGGPVVTLPRDIARVWTLSKPHMDAVLRPDVIFVGMGWWYSGERMYIVTVVAK